MCLQIMIKIKFTFQDYQRKIVRNQSIFYMKKMETFITRLLKILADFQVNTDTSVKNVFL